MDKDLVIVAIICVSITSFFLWYQLSIADLQNNNAWESTAVFTLALKGNSIDTNSSSVEFISRNIAVITSSGTYEVSGHLFDGQIIVDTRDSGTVKLIFKGVNINSSTSAPIWICRADEAVIFLEAGTENLVSDGASYLFANLTNNEPNAAIFSKADLTISGDGMLKVIGNYNDGIASKDGLIIESGTIIVQAVDDGIRGKDYIIIKGGSLVLDVGGDGLKSDNTQNAAMGYISIENGTMKVNSGGDAIQAETNILINGGKFNIMSGGGSLATLGNVSAKGIKATAGIVVNDGEFLIDSADDAIHSDGNLTFNGGTLTLLSGDDAIHANGVVKVNGSYIKVTRCFEGLEAAVVRIYDGTLYIVSFNDGIDAPVNLEIPDSGTVYIANGTIEIASGGDAIQADRDVLIDGGDFALTSGGGSNNTVASVSSKGIKGGYSVAVNGGKFTISSADDAIHSNGTVKLNQGFLVLSSSDDAVHADDLVEVNGGKINIIKSFEGVEGASVTINDGELNITSINNGIDAGVISVVKGVMNINSGGDAIQAETNIVITGGKFNIMSGGGNASAKGIKGGFSIKVDGGEFVINSADDAVHSDGVIIISGGSFTISTGDDGIHADSSITINDGDVRITKSYEGIEAPVITINNGNIYVVSSDDGVNLGVDSGMPRPNIGFSPGLSTYNGSYYLYINGGYLAINSLGDGIDSNGAVVMTGGFVVVDGPSSNMNSALDHVAFNITGGMIFAAGSSGMALPLGNLSAQYSVMVSATSPLSAGTIFHVRTLDGTEVFTFKPTKQYQTVIFSLPSLNLGATYEVYVGGSYTGAFKDGLGFGGTYTPGTKIYTFTITTKVTRIGPSGQFLPK